MLIGIELFGALKKFSPTGNIEIDITNECSVRELKALICSKMKNENREFSADSLVMSSALSDDSEIFQDVQNLPSGRQFSLLPPVCGG